MTQVIFADRKVWRAVTFLLKMLLINSHKKNLLQGKINTIMDNYQEININRFMLYRWKIIREGRYIAGPAVKYIWRKKVKDRMTGGNL